MVLLGILLIAAGILILALGSFPHANTLGLIVAVAGVVVILAAVLDDDTLNAASVIALAPRGRFRGWSKRTWPIRLRFALLMPFDCRWNGWARDFTAWLEIAGKRYDEERHAWVWKWAA